jgi:hypothetical protein
VHVCVCQVCVCVLCVCVLCVCVRVRVRVLHAICDRESDSTWSQVCSRASVRTPDHDTSLTSEHNEA